MATDGEAVMNEIQGAGAADLPLCAWRNPEKRPGEQHCPRPRRCHYLDVPLCDPHWERVVRLLEDHKDKELRKHLGKRAGEAVRRRDEDW